MFQKKTPNDIHLFCFQDNPAVVTTLDYRRHGLETGDQVAFREINGMTQLNGKTYKVEVLTPYKFSINCDTSSDEFHRYLHGGTATESKRTGTMMFQSLEKQLKSPTLMTVDLTKMDVPVQIFIGLNALHSFLDKFGRFPVSNSNTDFEEFLNLANLFNDSLIPKQECLDKSVLRCVANTSLGCFPCLCATLGGIAAQEVLKSVTGKFSPIEQWLLLDTTEVLDDINNIDLTGCTKSRYSNLLNCLGKTLVNKLKDIKLFMVGCGAIGCEMLKNFALLGIGSGDNGLITITDNDLIEKSNLNRQFLFRPQHIQVRP